MLLYRIAVVVLLLFATAVNADIIVRPKASAATTDLVTALRGKASTAREVELSGSSSADAALVPRESRSGDVVYAIGPDAVIAARAVDKKSRVVALNVPNPDRVVTDATYVSAYPSLKRIGAFLSVKLAAKRVGILYSPSYNHETALRFAGECAKNGMQAHPVPVTAGNAAASLRRAISGLDAVVLLIDPLVFDEAAMRDLVGVAGAAKVPTVGFLRDLTTVGVTIAIVASPSSVADTAVRSAAAASPGSRSIVESDAMDVIVSKQSAREVGLDPKAIGATTVR